MNIYNKINTIEIFTACEQAFLDYIIQNLQQCMNCNVKELSKKSNVSISTIYRVLEKLDLGGLNELKIMLMADGIAYKKEKNVDYNYPFKRYSTDYQIASSLNSLYEQTLESTFNLIDIDEFLKVVQHLKNAKNIYIFPSIGNYFIAECFQQNMLEIGVNVHVVKDRYYQHWTVSTMTKDDVAIMISYEGKTPHFVELAKEIQIQQTPIILISSTNRNELFDYAKHCIYFSSYEDSVEKIASFSSRISLQYIMDCIYASFFNSQYEKHLHCRINNYLD